MIGGQNTQRREIKTMNSFDEIIAGFDYQIEMENFYGDVIVLYGYDNGKAYIAIDTEGGIKEKSFSSYEKAYSYAYARGYIE